MLFFNWATDSAACMLRLNQIFYYTRWITPNRVTSWRAHLSIIASADNTALFQEMPPRELAVGKIIYLCVNWPARNFCPRPPPVDQASYPHAFEHVGASLQTTLFALFAVLYHFITTLCDNVLCKLTRSISTRKLWSYSVLLVFQMLLLSSDLCVKPWLVIINYLYYY